MVGSLQNPNSEEQQEKENFINPSWSLAGFEDLSLSYADAFLDFDYIKDWIEENPEPFKSMESDLGGRACGFSLEKVAYEVFDVSPEVGSAGIGEKIKVEEGLVGEEGENLGSLGPGKIEFLGSDKGGEMEKIKIEEGIEGENDLVSVGGMSRIQGGEEDCGNGNEVGGCNVVKDVEAVNVIGSGMENGVLVSLGAEVARTNEMMSLDGIQGKSSNQGSEGDEGDSDSNSESESDSDSDLESESDRESKSSSSSSLSSSSDEEEGDEKAKGGNVGQERKREELDMEEGEIVASDPEEMVAWSGDEYDEDDLCNGVASMGPPKSKNEVMVLPPVPPVNVTLQLYHEIQPVGAVLSVVGAQVIVEGVEKHNPLNEGSILWITDSRSPLGLVDEIFGPVRNPYYIVRYNSESEVPAGIQPGSSVSFVPEFANHILNDKSLYTKGYDASGANDEELLEEEEFSDDEKEAEYRKMLKNKKRGTNDDKVGNKKKDEKRSGNWSRNLKCDSTFNRHIPKERAKPQVDQSRHHMPPFGVPLHQGNQLPSSGPGQGFPSQPGLAPPFAQLASNSGLSARGVPLDQGTKSCSLGLGQTLAYRPGLAPPFAQLTLNSGVGASSSGANAIPFQLPQCVGFPQLPTNGMHWVQQINQLYQMPSQNRLPVQQQINAAPNFPSNLVLPGGQSNFGKEPALLSWPASLGQNTFSSPPFGMATLGQQVSLPINVREQAAPSNISETRLIDGSKQHTSFSGELDTSQRFSYGGGRKANRRGGGHFRGGRGRQRRG